MCLVLTRLKYGNATLAGLPRHLLDRLQTVLNATVRVILYACKYGHVATSTGITLAADASSNRIQTCWTNLSLSPQPSAVVSRRWLPLCSRCKLLTTVPVVSVDGCTVCATIILPLLVTMCSMWLPREHGTVYRPMPRRHHRCPYSSLTSRLFCSLKATPEASLAHDNFISLWLASLSYFCAVT